MKSQSELQNLAEYFHEMYYKACSTSHGAHWMDAALLGKQLVNALVENGTIKQPAVPIDFKESS